MNNPIESAHLLLISILFLCTCGALLLMSGSCFAKRADWLAWAAITLFAGALGFSGSSWSQNSLKPLIWARGWIGARGEGGALTFGILQDGPGILLSAVALLLTAVLIGGRAVIQQERRPERVLAGACWSLAGMALSWLALTPWISLIGWALVTFGGFVTLGSGWEDEGEAVSAIRFAKDRSMALVFAVLGLCGIAAAHSGLEWTVGAEWLTRGAGVSMVEHMGAILLLIGVYLQLQVFPLQGWTLGASEANISMRAVFGGIAPASAAFAVLYRTESFFKGMEVLPIFGVILLVSVMVTLFSAGVQSRWRQEFLSWLSSGVALSFAVLAFSGGAVAMSVFLGVILGGATMSCAATYMVRQHPDRKVRTEAQAAPRSGTRGWAVGLTFGGVCAATGMAGFISSGGFGVWIGGHWSDPVTAVAMGGVVLAFAFVGWKSAWRLAAMKRPVNYGWGTILAPALLMLASLGVFWTGTLSGSSVLGGADRVTQPTLVHIQQVEEASFPASAEASAICFAIAVGACIATYALSRRKEPLWNPQAGVGKNARQFIASGYRVDEGATWTRDLLSWLGQSVVDKIDRQAWTAWVGAMANRGLRALASAGSAFDSRITETIQRAVRAGIESPGTALQSLQNGDVQWYLMFAIGSSILILLHFLRT